MNKTIAYILYIALAVVSAALLVMTVLASAGVSSVWVGMPVIAVLLVLAIALIISIVAFNPKKTWYSIGFYILHIGIVLFLAGSLVYTVSGVETNAAPPSVSSITPTIEYKMQQNGITAEQIVNMKSYYNQLRRADGEAIELGFNFRITDFKTEYYDKEQKNVKHYEATLEFLNNDGSVDVLPLTVNHPIYRNGWKIYLMNVGVNEVYGYAEVQLMFKQDKTEFLSTSGIILTVLGTFIMCFMRPSEAMLKKREAEKKNKKKAQKVGGKAR